MVKRKGYLAWCEGRERFQLSVVDILRFLENIYVGHEWGSKGCFLASLYVKL